MTCSAKDRSTAHARPAFPAALSPCGCPSRTTVPEPSVEEKQPYGDGQRRKSGLRAILVILLVFGLFAAFKFLPVKEATQAFLEWVKGMVAWGPFLLGLAYVTATLLLIPGWLLTLGSGALFGLPLGVLTVAAGSNLGAALSFMIGRTVARGWVEDKIAENRKFKAIDEAVGKQGFKIVLLTRLSPVFPFNLQNYAYGVTKVSFGSYALASLIGMLPGTVMYVYLGSSARDLGALFEGDVGGSLVMKAVGLIATVAVTVWVTKIAKRALSEVAPGSAEESSRVTS